MALTFNHNGKLFVSGSNVGVGIDNPGAKLEVSGSDALINGVDVGRGGGNQAFNTRLGDGALAANTTGTNNTAIGHTALFSNTVGTSNIAVGRLALACNVSGVSNTAMGHYALLNNLASNNAAFGRSALISGLLETV